MVAVCLFKGRIWVVITGRQMTERPPGNGGPPAESAQRRVPGSHTDRIGGLLLFLSSFLSIFH